MNKIIACIICASLLIAILIGVNWNSHIPNFNLGLVFAGLSLIASLLTLLQRERTAKAAEASAKSSEMSAKAAGETLDIRKRELLQADYERMHKAIGLIRSATQRIETNIAECDRWNREAEVPAFLDNLRVPSVSAEGFGELKDPCIQRSNEAVIRDVQKRAFALFTQIPIFNQSAPRDVRDPSPRRAFTIEVDKMKADNISLRACLTQLESLIRDDIGKLSAGIQEQKGG